MSARTKKLLLLARENVTVENVMEENNGTSLSEPQTLCRTTTSVSNEEPHLSTSQCELTTTPTSDLMELQQDLTRTCSNVEPQLLTSQCDLKVTHVIEDKIFYVIQSTSSTRSVLRRVSTAAPKSPSRISESCSDVSSGSDDNYDPASSDEFSSSSEANAQVSANQQLLGERMHTEESATKKPKKRTRNVSTWGKVKAKMLKNSGKSYTSRTGKPVEARKMGAPCTEKCVLSCSKKLSEDYRAQVFTDYWALGSLQRQRDFLSSCIEKLVLKYRRITAQEPRRPNCAFYLMNNDQKVRVCKKFLMNTLGVTERTIRTVIQAKLTDTGMAPVDNRGKHDKRKTTDPEILNSFRGHINSVPRIESHYVRRDTNREFIDGGLSIAEMHRHYSSERSFANLPAANYDTYARIFNTEFNIGFFLPRKDQCDQCDGYKNATDEEKAQLEENFQKHQEEKVLSRTEKDVDKEKAKNSEIQLAVYDLQAVLPVPMGQTSAFFYKSRLNCYNFTVTDMGNNKSLCFFWYEGIGNRGVNEIATCVLRYLEELSSNIPVANVVFYSDNCGGQQKNRYMVATYLYAVQHLNIQSISHKYLIRGHTQNEGDAIHSIIEKSVKSAKRSGPIYVPDQYVTIIRHAKKKGEPLRVIEMSFEDFMDIKALHDQMAPYMVKDVGGNIFKLSEVKIFRFEKGSNTFYYKNRYKQSEWSQVQFTGKKRRTAESIPATNISLKPAYTKKIALSENKIRDLNGLVNSNIIPRYYKGFYDSLTV